MENREIKFRAFWNGRIYKVNFIDFKNNTIDLDVDGVATTVSMKLVDLMQYTGLKDKNGKEIYEGDILANKKIHKDNFYCLVECQLDGFYGTTYPYENYNMPLHTIMTYEGAEYNEIIGNIYENRNLIEDNK